VGVLTCVEVGTGVARFRIARNREGGVELVERDGDHAKKLALASDHLPRESGTSGTI
jgi:hypothetical protein